MWKLDREGRGVIATCFKDGMSPPSLHISRCSTPCSQVRDYIRLERAKFTMQDAKELLVKVKDNMKPGLTVSLVSVPLSVCIPFISIPITHHPSPFNHPSCTRSFLFWAGGSLIVHRLHLPSFSLPSLTILSFLTALLFRG